MKEKNISSIKSKQINYVGCNNSAVTSVEPEGGSSHARERKIRNKARLAIYAPFVLPKYPNKGSVNTVISCAETKEYEPNMAPD